MLGDTKQFAKVKSHNASAKVNNVLFNRVRDAFKKDIINRPELVRESLVGNSLESVSPVKSMPKHSDPASLIIWINSCQNAINRKRQISKCIETSLRL